VIEDGSAAALVLEYLPGGTLRERIGGGALPLERIVECGIQIADGWPTPTGVASCIGM
jgi:hypothetical protein